MCANRILICRGGALGDLLLTFPLLAAVRRRWPAAHITLAAYPPQARLARVAGWVDALVSLDSGETAEWFAPGVGLSGTVRAFLKAFDLAISLLHDPDGRCAARLRGAGIARVVTRSPLVRSGHAIDHLLAALCELGISWQSGAAADLPLPETVACQGRDLVRAFGADVVAIHPGSGSTRKNWPAEQFAALARLILAQARGTPVFVLGDAETGLEDRLGRLCPGVAILRSPDIVDLAAFLRACRGYVGNDSGVTHLAAAVGIPVVALFGVTDPTVWAPRGAHVRVADARTARPEELAGWL